MGKQDTEKQWSQLMEYINKYITGSRKEQLVKMYEELSEKILTAPASSHSTRHNCFPGGYIDHVNRVVKCAITLFESWGANGAGTNKYTIEELVFAAINHDLGKIGSRSMDYYIPNDSKWHIERGQIYKINGALTYMKVPDRSLFTLQEFGIKVTENEYLAIKLHDGLYGKGNESYFMAGQPEFALKNDMPVLLHHADHMATLIEGNIAHSTTVVEVPSTPTRMKSNMTNINNPVADENLKSAFDKIFGE